MKKEYRKKTNMLSFIILSLIIGLSSGMIKGLTGNDNLRNNFYITIIIAALIGLLLGMFYILIGLLISNMKSAYLIIDDNYISVNWKSFGKIEIFHPSSIKNITYIKKHIIQLEIKDKVSKISLNLKGIPEGHHSEIISYFKQYS